MIDSLPTLNIAFIQFNIEWEDTSKNLDKLSKLISTQDKSIDLIVLPEMFHCGFTMKPQTVAESMDGQVVNWMKDIALSQNIAICGSAAISENDKIFNRFLFVEPNGTLTYYDKKHLFRMGGEHEVYTAGNQQVVVDFKGWRIMPLICYDLRFPVWSRNATNCDLLLYVANWPTARQEVWDVLLRARAIENQCYVLGVNRIGSDGYVQYSGGSLLLDPRGKVIGSVDGDNDSVIVNAISKDDLLSFRQKFPAYLDADKFSFF